MTGATKKTAGFYFHCGPYTKYNWIFWFFKKSCWEKIVKVIIIIMIIDAYYPEDVYGHRNGSILGGSLCTNHWASRPYWGKFNVNVHSHTM